MAQNNATLNAANRLLSLARQAEEVRILGKILKINQGMPTNIGDFYDYTKSIEKYISSRINSEWDDEIKSVKRAGEGEDKTLRYITNAKVEILKSQKRRYFEKFNLQKFISDDSYRERMTKRYDQYKINFNILDAISNIPHFSQMFSALSVNRTILDELSVRNKLVNQLLDNSYPFYVTEKINRETGEKEQKKNININGKLNHAQIQEVKDAVDSALIQKWIYDKNIVVTLEGGKEIALDSKDGINAFVSEFVENFVVPKLKKELPNNEFVRQLTFGLRKTADGKDAIKYRLPYDMTAVANTRQTQVMYENALSDFNTLKDIKINGINAISDNGKLSIVDIFYLYNLIVNRDKFGATSFTRIFEDLVSAKDGDKLLINDFNNWIDKQSIDDLMPYVENPYNERLSIDDKINLWCDAEGWNQDYFKDKVMPKISEAWSIRYKLSDDQSTPTNNIANSNYSYGKKGLPFLQSSTTIEAIKAGERTSTTRYKSDGHIEFWRNLKIGDRLMFKNDSGDFVFVEITKPLSKLSDYFGVDTKTTVEKSKVKEAFAAIDESKSELANLNNNDSSQSKLYDTSPSVQAELIAKVKAANNPYLKVISNSDFDTMPELKGIENSAKYALGFIKNGIIYINSDLANSSTVVHELGHIYLADAKRKHPTEYYKLLELVRDTKRWQEMRSLKAYANKRGSDFDEEVLATILGDLYKKANENKDVPWFEFEEDENSLGNDLLNLVSDDFKSLLSNDVLPKLDNVFFDEYKESQKVATLKNRLYEENLIKENCK